MSITSDGLKSTCPCGIRECQHQRGKAKLRALLAFLLLPCKQILFTTPKFKWDACVHWTLSSVQIGLQCLYSRPSGFNPPPRLHHFIFPFSLTLVSAFVVICGAQWALLIPDIIFKDIIWKREIKESNAIYNPPFFSSPVFATTTQQSVNHLDLLNTCDNHYLEMIMMIPERALWHSDDDTHLWCRSLSRW